MWIGTNVGLNLFNYSDNTFTHFTKEHGFNNDSIRSIVEGTDSKLWIGTANGISSFDPETYKIKNYSRDAGKLMGAFFYNGGITSAQDEIILGGINGLRIFKPNEISNNQHIPPIAFTNLKIFSEDVVIGGENNILTQHINYTNSITLSHFDSNFVIEFISLNFRDPTKNQYAYKLDGFDKNWNYIGDEKKAKYTNLDPGVYTFRVKGSNNDGLWNETGRAIIIRQLPAPWLTWWAKSIYALIVTSLLYALLRHQRTKRQRVEKLNRLLEEKVAERTLALQQKNEDVQSMLSHIEQGLLTINQDIVIHPEYSKYLDEIFEIEQFGIESLSGLDAIDIIFSHSNASEKEISQIRDAIETAMNKEQTLFDINSHLLPKETTITLSGQEKLIELDWNPILHENIVQKLMITLRDVTFVREMEREAQQKERELKMVSELLHTPSSNFVEFNKSAESLINKNMHILQNGNYDSDNTDELMRNMHTIKGNAGGLALSYMSECAHNIESSYVKLKQQYSKNWNKSALIRELNQLSQIREEYTHCFSVVLGRCEGDSLCPQEGIVASTQKLNIIEKSILELTQTSKNSNALATASNALEEILYAPISEIIKDHLHSVSAIAKQLNKKTPRMVISAEGIYFRKQEAHHLTDILLHLIRNALDHGLETPDERLKVKKPIEGCIDITFIKTENHVNICFKDDGRGINIPKLHELGLAAGKINNNADDQSIANLIFSPGVSTASEINDFSGRGVGMDAVKQFVENEKGSISIELIGRRSENSAFIPFELLIQLPQENFLFKT